jgi:hypothetical protein
VQNGHYGTNAGQLDLRCHEKTGHKVAVRLFTTIGRLQTSAECTRLLLPEQVRGFVGRSRLSGTGPSKIIVLGAPGMGSVDNFTNLEPLAGKLGAPMCA